MNQPRGFRPSTVGNPSASRRQRPRKLDVALIAGALTALSVSPSWATITRGRPFGAVPGRANAASRATPSMKASSWLGS